MKALINPIPTPSNLTPPGPWTEIRLQGYKGYLSPARKHSWAHYLYLPPGWEVRGYGPLGVVSGAVAVESYMGEIGQCAPSYVLYEGPWEVRPHPSYVGGALLLVEVGPEWPRYGGTLRDPPGSATLRIEEVIRMARESRFARLDSYPLSGRPCKVSARGQVNHAPTTTQNPPAKASRSDRS